MTHFGSAYRSMARLLHAAYFLMATTAIAGISMPTAIGQLAGAPQVAGQAIAGRVLDSRGNPVSGATVRLETDAGAGAGATLTDTLGTYRFAALQAGTYTVIAEKDQVQSRAVTVSFAGTQRSIELTLASPLSKTAAPMNATSPTNQAIEFSDNPNFTIAGVTDWTAVGGHGSDAVLRTSEELARDTLTLKSQGGSDRTQRNDDKEETRLLAAFKQAPGSYTANRDLGEYYLRAARYREAVPLLEFASAIDHAQAADEYNLALACRGVGDYAQAQHHIERAIERNDVADWHRFAGEVDEKLGAPLAAVQQEERAARLDPSEENYFAWGSELLLHRAVWEAAEVFKNGAKAHSASTRLLTGWGAALFAGAMYDEAAQRLCQAADLNPIDPEPYLFLGKVELAAPAPLPCVEDKLAQFVRLQPNNASANYLYAMALEKREDPSQEQQAEGLLKKVVTLKPDYADAYLQLGILAFARREVATAIGYYLKAIKADPKLAEAHYRLGVAYRSHGELIEAKQEFQAHDALEKARADAIDQQRRDIKQFSVALRGAPQPLTAK